MGVLINHAIAIATSPMSVGMLLLAAGCGFLLRGRCRLGRALVLAGFFGLWFFSTGVFYRAVGSHLEGTCPPARVETLPSADAIVLLGGGVGANTNACPYAELFWSADRVAQAARLWKAGKAPVVVTSGSNERCASFPLLQEFGVPERAIVVENESRNTEENAKFVYRMLTEQGKTKPRILLVTSAWHMRRSLLMFRKYAPQLDVVPSAADYEATLNAARPLEFKDFLPSAEALDKTSYMIKEIIGYWGYRLLR